MRLNEQRIELTDSAQDVMVKMSDGNPGALHALCSILKESPSIDPQGAMGGLGPILSLDTLGIYGSEIYILHNNQCHRDTRELLMLLRANQLGFISSGRIQKIARSQMRDTLLSKDEMDKLNCGVMNRLPSFKPRKETSDAE